MDVLWVMKDKVLGCLTFHLWMRVFKGHSMRIRLNLGLCNIFECEQGYHDIEQCYASSCLLREVVSQMCTINYMVCQFLVHYRKSYKNWILRLLTFILGQHVELIEWPRN